MKRRTLFSLLPMIPLLRRLRFWPAARQSAEVIEISSRNWVPPPPFAMGDIIELETDDGPRPYRVISVEPGRITLDPDPLPPAA
jgi:hypothetical protein